MANYLFIESRDPFESRDTDFISETAAALQKRGHDVTVFLVQNGVLGARKNARGSHLPKLSEAGVRLLADDFALKRTRLSVQGIAGRSETGKHRHASRFSGAR